MIRELHLKNFLFIREASIEFSPGLNVITGETGAGKSVLLEAVRLILGKKARAGLVLAENEKCVIQARFFPLSDEVSSFLSDSGFSDEDDPESLEISRFFKKEGTGRILVNGILATGSLLKRLGVFLMEIHGQNEHQTLLDPDVQLMMLDRMGGPSHRKILSDYLRLFQSIRELVTQIEEIGRRTDDTRLRLDDYSRTISDIDSLNLEDPSDEEALKEEENRLSHSEAIAAAYGSAVTSLSGDDDKPGAVELVYLAKQSLSDALRYDSRLTETLARLEEVHTTLQDLQNNLSRQKIDNESDPGRLAEVQARLAEVSRLSRRYRTDFSGLLKLRDQFRAEIEAFESNDDTMLEMTRQLGKLESQLSEKAVQLSSSRRKAATRLGTEVSQSLSTLGFNRSQFEIFISSERKPGPSGFDQAEFIVSLNPGSAPAPLRKIASGGELSRVALAIKKTLAKGDGLATLLFDEIDTGIGGTTAGAVSASLKQLSSEKQVLLVTHLHQIAKEADRHFTVTKSVEGDQTFIAIGEVRQAARQEEIARMLGSIGDESLSFARTLLKEQK